MVLCWIVLVSLAILYSLPKILAWRLPKLIGLGLCFALLSMVGAAPSQRLQGVVLIGIKVATFFLTIYLSSKRPRLACATLAAGLLTGFVVGLETVGYTKYSAFPVIELFSLASVWFVLDGNAKLDFRFLWITAVALCAIVAQGFVLESRTDLIFACVTAVVILTPTAMRIAVVRWAWLLPVIYFFALGTIGRSYWTGSFHLLPPTASNIERSSMAAVLLNHVADSAFGINQATFSGLVNQKLGLLSLQGYSETAMDPHGFLMYLLMYSGTMSALLGVWLSWQLCKKMADKLKPFPDVVVLLLPAVMSVFFAVASAPPSTEKRAYVGVAVGLLIAGTRFMSRKPVVERSVA